MAELVPTSYGLCACGQSLPSAGAKRCPRCQAAHARKHIGRRARQLHRLPHRADFDDEVTWVACNLGLKHAELATAPSREAVGLLAALNADDKLRNVFWATHIKARLEGSYDY